MELIEKVQDAVVNAGSSYSRSFGTGSIVGWSKLIKYNAIPILSF